MGHFYEEASNRLSSFYKSLPDTNIKFLFFDSTSRKPHVKGNFKKWVVNGEPHYVMRGKEENFMYIYQETQLKYTVDVVGKCTSHVGCFVVKLKNKKGDTNHGNHIDFAVCKQRNLDKVLVKTHLTMYTCYDKDDDDYDFSRDVYHCNIVFDKNNLESLQHISNFASLECETLHTPFLYCFGTLYTNKLYIPFHLCRKVFIDNVDGGGRKKKCLKTSSFGYKGICMMSKEFQVFLHNLIFKNIPDVHSAVFVYDETNELLPNGNKNIICILEFEEYKTIMLSIDAKKALQACYVENVMNGKNETSLTITEKQNHTKFAEWPLTFHP